MRKDFMLKRAACVVLSTTLVCTLCPYVAFASEDNAIDTVQLQAESKISTTEIEPSEDVIHASVSIDKSAPKAMFSYNNLIFQINEDAENTVTLLGFGAKPQNTLEIPETVVYGNVEYTVTNISTLAQMGGGVL
ncbi:hypothetical protein [Adlercreutzia sp. ZJ154]|uniref:hypothetical protein n=1 Tax=Adlercreutzia sp. ZJ154 TaxID=2709790 RepID=UPI0013EBDBDC|nr:hypothetical protein [Adlercreutzia sp. ZJ154]